MLNVGKLYKIKKYFWYLYPSKETAALARIEGFHADAGAARTATAATAHWSERFNCNVTFVSENSIFCLLEEDGKYLKILSTNGELGWMIYRNNEERNKGCIEEVT